MGLGATVGVLGMRVPRLACLRPATWLKEWPSTAHLHQHMLKILARGQASRGRMIGGFPRHGLVRLAREEVERPRRGTSRCARDASHDDQGQAGASGRSVPVSSLVPREQAQARASSKGNHFGATRPRAAGRQNGGHRGARAGVIIRVFGRRGPTLVRISVLDVPLQNGKLLAPFPLNIWEEARGLRL